MVTMLEDVYGLIELKGIDHQSWSPTLEEEFFSPRLRNQEVSDPERYLLSLIPSSILLGLKRCSAIIAGGCISSLFSGRGVNDIDIFFPDSTSFYKTYRTLQTGSWPSVNDTSWANSYLVGGYTFQLIQPHRYHGGVKEILGSFDFRACQGAYLCREGQFFFEDGFLEDNQERILRPSPGCTPNLPLVTRMEKYIAKGYEPSPGLLKLIESYLEETEPNKIKSEAKEYLY